jgi:HEAT repeat protein
MRWFFLLLALACNQPSHRGRNLSSWIVDLKDKETFRQRAACEAVAAMGPEAARAIPAVLPLLRHSNPGIQGFAALALASIGAASVPHVTPLLQDPDPTVHLHAAHTLLRIDGDNAEARSVLAKVVTGVGNAELASKAQEFALGLKADLTAQVVPFLQDPYGPVRMQSVKTLHRMGPRAKAALPALQALLADKDTPLRVAALRAMADIGEREALEPFYRGLLQDESGDVATTAALMLKHIGVRESASGNEQEPIAPPAPIIRP